MNIETLKTMIDIEYINIMNVITNPDLFLFGGMFIFIIFLLTVPSYFDTFFLKEVKAVDPIDNEIKEIRLPEYLRIPLFIILISFLFLLGHYIALNSQAIKSKVDRIEAFIDITNNPNSFEKYIKDTKENKQHSLNYNIDIFNEASIELKEEYCTLVNKYSSDGFLSKGETFIISDFYEKNIKLPIEKKQELENSTEQEDVEMFNNIINSKDVKDIEAKEISVFSHIFYADKIKAFEEFKSLFYFLFLFHFFRFVFKKTFINYSPKEHFELKTSTELKLFLSTLLKTFGNLKLIFTQMFVSAIITVMIVVSISISFGLKQGHIYVPILYESPYVLSFNSGIKDHNVESINKFWEKGKFGFKFFKDEEIKSGENLLIDDGRILSIKYNVDNFAKIPIEVQKEYISLYKSLLLDKKIYDYELIALDYLLEEHFLNYFDYIDKLEKEEQKEKFLKIRENCKSCTNEPIKEGI